MDYNRHLEGARGGGGEQEEGEENNRCNAETLVIMMGMWVKFKEKSVEILSLVIMDPKVNWKWGNNHKIDGEGGIDLGCFKISLFSHPISIYEIKTTLLSFLFKVLG